MVATWHRRIVFAVLALVGLLAPSCLHPQRHSSAVLRGRREAAAHADPPNRWTSLEWPLLDSPWEAFRFSVSLSPLDDRKGLRADVVFLATLPAGLSEAERSAFLDGGPKIGDLAVVLRLSNGVAVAAVPAWTDLAWHTTHPRFPSADAMYLIPWQGNDMQEGWLDVDVRGQRYWFAIPYGFLRDVTLRELPTGVEGSADARLVAGWSTDARLVNVARVEYDLCWTGRDGDLDADYDGFTVTLVPGRPLRGSFRFRSKRAEPALYTSTCQVCLAGWRTAGLICAEREDADDTASGYDGWNRGDGFVFPPSSVGGPGRYWAQLTVELGPHRFTTALPSSLLRPADG
jgi:hypothetical protein